MYSLEPQPYQSGKRCHLADNQTDETAWVTVVVQRSHCDLFPTASNVMGLFGIRLHWSPLIFDSNSPIVVLPIWWISIWIRNYCTVGPGDQTYHFRQVEFRSGIFSRSFSYFVTSWSRLIQPLLKTVNCSCKHNEWLMLIIYMPIRLCDWPRFVLRHSHGESLSSPFQTMCLARNVQCQCYFPLWEMQHGSIRQVTWRYRWAQFLNIICLTK